MSDVGLEQTPGAQQLETFRVYGLIDNNLSPILVGEVTLKANMSLSRPVNITAIKLFDEHGVVGSDEFSVINELNRLEIEHIEVWPVTVKNEGKVLDHYWSPDISANRLIHHKKYKI